MSRIFLPVRLFFIASILSVPSSRHVLRRQVLSSFGTTSLVLSFLQPFWHYPVFCFLFPHLHKNLSEGCLLECLLSSCLLSSFSSIIRCLFVIKNIFIFLDIFSFITLLSESGQEKMRCMRLSLHSQRTLLFIFTCLYLPVWWWMLRIKQLFTFCCLTWK